jgi:hypothetical protein
MYILLSSNTGEDTLGPISVIHKSEGLRGMLDAETPVRIELPRNIFHECVSDIAAACLPINGLFENIYLLKNSFHLIPMKIRFGFIINNIRVLWTRLSRSEGI